jgi:hypothetical protein
MVRQQKKTAAEIFDAAESNGARPVEETEINGDPVPRVLQTGTEHNYNRMIDLWDEYASNPGMPEREYLLIITLLGGTDTRGELREPTLTICGH